MESYQIWGERGGSVVECRTPEREVRGSRPTAAVLCPWARHFTPRKYWLITQEAMAPSRHDWKIVDWDVKPQHNQPTYQICIDIIGKEQWVHYVWWYAQHFQDGNNSTYHHRMGWVVGGHLVFYIFYSIGSHSHFQGATLCAKMLFSSL